jgi:phosphate:Na+ symporter
MLQNTFLAIGGLGLLLFGIKMVSSGLEAIAGDRLQSVLKRATSNRFLATVVGLIATIIINSSTAVSVITVGFVNAGLMNLTQAIGVLLGINVGTTFSAQLIAFRIDAYAPIFMFIGVVLYLFFKKRSVKNVGYAILGFGVLFFSITVMGDALRVFRDHPAFVETITNITNPLLALLIGFLFTVAVQSSSATMGLLVTLHLNDVPIPFEASAFIILGANIGTSVTAVIASIPASRDSKRTALFHITYDIIGSIVFGSLILLLPGILAWFQTAWTESARQVAMFHTLYNVATLLLLISFVPLLAKLMRALIPVKSDEANEIHERRLLYLETKSPQLPTLAVVNAHLEICRMGKITVENLGLALESFFEQNTDKADRVIENEKTIDFLNNGITSKLVEINNMALSAADAEKVGGMFGVLTDIERVGDHAENIAEYTIAVKDAGLIFTEAATEELKTLGKLAEKITQCALDVFDTRDNSKLPQVRFLEEQIDKLSVEFTRNHINRLKTEDCEPASAVIFTDMITDLERIGDHAENIAYSIISNRNKGNFLYIF